MHANNIDQVTKCWEYAGSDAFTEVRVVVELIIPVCMMLVFSLVGFEGIGGVLFLV